MILTIVDTILSCVTTTRFLISNPFSSSIFIARSRASSSILSSCCSSSRCSTCWRIVRVSISYSIIYRTSSICPSCSRSFSRCIFYICCSSRCLNFCLCLSCCSFCFYRSCCLISSICGNCIICCSSCLISICSINLCFRSCSIASNISLSILSSCIPPKKRIVTNSVGNPCTFSPSVSFTLMNVYMNTEIK